MFENLFDIPLWKICILLLVFVVEQPVTFKILRPKFKPYTDWRAIFAYAGMGVFMFIAGLLVNNRTNMSQYWLVMFVYLILSVAYILLFEKKKA